VTGTDGTLLVSRDEERCQRWLPSNKFLAVDECAPICVIRGGREEGLEVVEVKGAVRCAEGGGEAVQ